MQIPKEMVVGHGELSPSIWPAAPEVGPRTLPPPLQSIPAFLLYNLLCNYTSTFRPTSYWVL